MVRRLFPFSEYSLATGDSASFFCFLYSLRLTPCTLSRLFRKILPDLLHFVEHLSELVKKGHLLKVPSQRNAA